VLASNRDGPFVVCELGCATGANSVEPIRRVLEAVPRDRQVLVYQNDLPSNAWIKVLDLVPQWSDERSSHAILGRSFYEPLLPPNSVDLSFSSTAIHWCSHQVPMPAVRSLGMTMEQFYVETSDVARSTFEQLVGNTLKTLRPGGIAVWQFPGLVGDPAKDTALAEWLDLLIDAFCSVLHLTEEVDRKAMCTHYACYRSVELCKDVLVKAGAEIVSADAIVGSSMPPGGDPKKSAVQMMHGVMAAIHNVCWARAQQLWPDRVKDMPESEFEERVRTKAAELLAEFEEIDVCNLVLVFRKKAQ